MTLEKYEPSTSEDNLQSQAVLDAEGGKGGLGRIVSLRYCFIASIFALGADKGFLKCCGQHVIFDLRLAREQLESVI